MKKPNGMKSSSDMQNDIMLKQRQVYIFTSYTCKNFKPVSNHCALLFCSIGEIMDEESWQSNIDTHVSTSQNLVHIC